MESNHKNNSAPFNRGTGLLIIEVRYSNPNGDPDAEGEPRTIDPDGLGLISPVSFKRKLRDLVANKDGFAWVSAKQSLQLEAEGDQRRILVNTRRGLGQTTEPRSVKAKYNILETRFRPRGQIKLMNAFDFGAEFWDARLFGNTFLESLKEGDQDAEESAKDQTKKDKSSKLEELEKREHFISTGAVQFGPGISVAPVSVIRDTWTNKAGVEEGKERGMAPMAWRVVQHAVYVMPFFVNSCMATKTGCGLNDLKLMQFMIPYAYPLNPSVARPHVEIRHAWYAEHKSPLGSCPDSLIIDALTPKKTKGAEDEPSTSIDEYEPILRELPEGVRNRLESFEDLCMKQWG
jgi:CRISPR/Cas system type I-B associated protein Csh2 (Cas7 group RAMP superfamily)